MSFVQSSESERIEVDIPDTVIDFFQTCILASTDYRLIDPIAFPADAALALT